MSELIIESRVIRQVNGLCCLNDLHKASGGANRHRPSFWLQNQQTIELIEELEKECTVGIPTVKQKQQVIKTINGGHGRGTYACRELVLAYATWISPHFFLQVLRTFDAVHSGSLKAVDLPPSAPHYLLLDALKHAPLRPPRSLVEADLLAEEVRLMEYRLFYSIQWLAYWRDVRLDERGYLQLPMLPR